MADVGLKYVAHLIAVLLKGYENAERNGVQIRTIHDRREFRKARRTALREMSKGNLTAIPVHENREGERDNGMFYYLVRDEPVYEEYISFLRRHGIEGDPFFVP